MDSYREKHKPSILKEFFSDSRIQLFFLATIAVTAFLFLYKQQYQRIESRIQLLQGQLQIASSENADVSGSSTTPSTADTLPSESTSDTQPTQAESASTNPTASALTPAPSASESKSAPATLDNRNVAASSKNGEHELRVIYAEIPRKILLELFEESQSIGQFIDFEDYQAGILSDFDRRIESKEIQVLAEEKKPFTIGQPINWFAGIKDRNDLSLKIGFEIFIDMSLTDNTWKGNLDMQRSWREAPSFEIQRKNYPAMFEITPKSVFFVSGFLPRRSIPADEDGLSALPVFKILKSQNFQSGRSEFVVIYSVTR